MEIFLNVECLVDIVRAHTYSYGQKIRVTNIFIRFFLYFGQFVGKSANIFWQKLLLIYRVLKIYI